MKKIKALVAILACLLLSTCFFACGKAELSLEKKSVVITVGETVQIKAESSRGGEVSWTTDDTDVIELKGNQITAIKDGYATVIVTADGVTKTVNVTVRALKEYVVNVDGVAQTVVAGEKAVRPETNPVKEEDAQYTYDFAGYFIKGTDEQYDFSKPVEKALVIESRYNKTVKEYGVSFDGAEAIQYAYGALVSAPEAPVKEADEQYGYTFDGWFVKGTDKEWNFRSDKVTGALELESRYVATVRTYTVNVNGAISFVKYGETVTAPAATPVKASSADKDYTFDKWVIAGTDTTWTFASDVVTGDVTIEPAFTATDRLFSVVFMVDGAEYESYGPFKNGTTFVAPETPAKDAEEGKQFVFKGWYVQGTANAWTFGAIDGSAIKGNVITLVANFVCTDKKLTVTLNDGENITTKSVEYGSIVSLPVATKADDALNTYVFKNWVDANGNAYAYTPITSDVTFIAEFTAQPKVYTVSTYLDTGKLLNKVTVKGGSEATRPAVPVKESTATTTYTFDKWVVLGTDVEWNWTTKITEDVSIVAVFTESPRLYTVFVNGYAQQVGLGGKVAKPDDAVKADDDSNSYEFVSWVLADTGAEWNFDTDTVNRDLNIIATFKAVPLKYYVVMNGVTTVYQYGDKVVKPADPVKESDAQYHYHFVKWIISGRTHVWDFNFDVIENKWLVGKTLTLEPVYEEELRSYDVTVEVNGAIVLEGVYFYGDKVVCPTVNTDKAMTESTIYTFAGWANGATAWDFDTSTVSGPTAIVAVYDEEDRKYDYTLTFTTEKMTLAGLTDYTLFDVDYSIVNVSASGNSKTFNAVNGANNVVLSMPKGDYTITVKYKNATYTKNVSMGYANKSEEMYLNQIVDIGGKMTGTVGGKTYAYPSFGSNRTYGENSVSMTDITYVYVGEEITDTYYLEADVLINTDGKMIGFMGASEFGNLSNDADKKLQGADDKLKYKLTFSFSGNNRLYYSHDNGWNGGNITVLQGGIDTNYANRLSWTKMAVLRKGYDYYIFLNGKLITHRYDTKYGKGGFGFVAPQGGGKLDAKNIRYTVKPDVVDAILAKYDTGVFLGGSFTYPNGTTYNSFGSGWSLTSHNSGTINRTSYLYLTDMVGSTYYIEATFENTNNWVGLLVNTLDLEPQKNKGWLAFGRYGEAGASGSELTTYYHNYKGSWSEGDGVVKSFFPAGDWKIGVARVNRSYYLYYNDVRVGYWADVDTKSAIDNSVQLPADNKSGMGIFCGSNLTGVAKFRDVWATTDATKVQEIITKLG